MKEGEVSEKRIDDAVYRILKMKKNLGLFDKALNYAKDFPKFGSKEHETVAYKAASEAITLLQNTNNILPLPKNVRVLVTGPNANSMRALNGGWSYSWQGEKADQFAAKCNTFLEAVSNEIGEKNVQYIPGINYIETGKYWEEKENQWMEAISQAKQSDIILFFAGENSYTEKPGDLNDLTLSDLQTNYAHALINTGKPVVLVLNEGRPRCINSLVSKVPAIIQTYLPGNYGGDALADILFGDINPSGKLPYTYPSYPNSIANYYHKPSESQVGQAGAYLYESDYNPQWEFGFGLSYTQFEYKNLKTDKDTYSPNDSIIVTVDVSNTGNREGKESILLYTSDLIASISPDTKRLRRFTKQNFQVGETKQIQFVVYPRDLAFVNLKNEWVTEKGEFEFKIGSLTKKITIN